MRNIDMVDATPARTESESQSRYGTVAFGYEFMLDTIRWRRGNEAFDVTEWLECIPPAYKPAAEAALARVRSRIASFGPEEFVEELHREVWRSVQPRAQA